ncbi:hypothetical protein ACLKA7_005477 [Drosophila subpalustris]
MGPPEPSTSGNTQSCKDNRQVRRWRLTLDGSEKITLGGSDTGFSPAGGRSSQELILDARKNRADDGLGKFALIKVNIKDSISRVICHGIMYITSLEMLRDECHDAEKWVANRWSRPVGSQPPLRPFKERHHVQEVYASEPEEMPDGEPAEAVEALYRPSWRRREGSSPDVGNVDEIPEMPVEKQSPGQDKSGGVMLCGPSKPIYASSNCMLAINARKIAVQITLEAGGPELIEQLGLKMTPSTTTVQAAGGTKHKIKATIKYANKERYLALYVCPSLQQSLYIGIDFWRKFGLAPSIVGVEALDQVES